jgi:hypothetical protein
LAGLAQVHVHVDEPGRDDRSGRIVDLRVAAVEVLADLRDTSIPQEHVAHGVELLCRVDDPAAANE